MNARRTQISSIVKLYGDPEQYVHKFGNDSLADKLPIHMNSLRFRGYGYFGSIALYNKQQIVWFGNNVDQRIEYGYFIHKNATSSLYFRFAPETNQVLQHY